MIKLKKPKFIFLKIPKKVVACVAIIFTAFLFYQALFLGRIYPRVSIAGINVAGKTPQEAIELLQKQVNLPKEISLIYNGQSYLIPTSNFDLEYNFAATVSQAYQTFRSDGILSNLFYPFVSLFKATNMPLGVKINKDKFVDSLSTISSDVSQEPVYPSIYLTGGKLVVERGSPGYEIDHEKTITDVISSLGWRKGPPVSISTKNIDPSLNGIEATLLYDRGNILLVKNLKFTFEFQEVAYTKSDLLALLNPKGGYNQENINSLVKNISSKVERKPQNPVFVFQEGKVNEFAPAKDGIEVKKGDLAEQIKIAMTELENTDKKEVVIAIPTINTPPDYTIADVNNLGIQKLLGRGVSHFAGSITSRIHNIVLASSKFNGVLVSPAETLSFNATLGDISAYTGYQQAYIIQEGKTVLGDGGGVCQVSTTFFRAALNAGLPIVERRAHAYRVGYYEQGSPVGLDATVFSPTTDFKFKNDTPAHLLIQTSVDTKTKTLVFEIYGTSDGRVATTSKPVMTGVTPPPDDLYIDDPTLPADTVKQIDWKAWGAKVSFKYTVTRGGETLIEKTFYSNYQPWQARFLRGTGPAQ